MFQSSRKTMRWASLLKDIKEKVGLSQSQHQTANSSPAVAAAAAAASGAGASGAPDSSSTPYVSPSSSPARGKYELEVDFKRFWEEFRSSSSEKEKEAALNMALDAFCRLMKQQSDVAHLVTKLDLDENLESLYLSKMQPVDKQPLLDSGILCCLIQILNALLNPDESSHRLFVADEAVSSVKSSDGDNVHVRRLEVEGSVVHIMKALASHPSAAPSLIEDDSLQLLFHMVTNGSLNVFSQFKDGLVRLHTIQLHRHAMQILGLLLTNDNGSTANYIHKHHLIKVLLTAVKDFNPEKGDPAYTMGIVDLLLECVELSAKPEAGQIRLREDIHNAHGYQYLVQFALTLSSLHRDTIIQSANPDSYFQNSDSSFVLEQEFSGRGDPPQSQLSPTLSRLLDVLVNLAQTGPADPISTGRGSKSDYGKASTHNRSRTSSRERFGDEMWEKGDMRIKDLEAIQMLQDIFLKADNVELQAELLSFDQQYKKVLREVGVLEVLLDDLRQHKFISGIEQQNNPSNTFEKTLSSSGFKKHMADKDAILSSPRFLGSGSSKFPIFEDEGTSAVAWDCLSSLLKKSETNQQSFRSCNGFSTVLPFLASVSHRSGVLRLLSCLIIEDSLQTHHEELGSLVEVLKSGMITSVLGSQYKLENNAKCDTFGTLWRILGSNNSAQRVFGEATGFSLLLTTLHSFQNSDDATRHSSLLANTKVFSFLLRVITAGVCNNPINRVRLHAIMSSPTFHDLLCESGLLCVDCEKQVIQLLLELALEIVSPPSMQAESGSSSDTFEEECSFLSNPSLAIDRPDQERVYNASAVGLLIRSLLLFTPKVQLEVLKFIEKLAHASPFNQESLTSIGKKHNT
ncbi:hypothetical protein MA16_Dca023195 [Dendrobium catenatum]|uniref:Uncharacterized protein n=1 Tax=Dendrobium catenatum TaxID=906689 RepID=A0A2I0VQ95_9ASPA|nr:hypothetical protein MA16_Dca023195 [Dendrobium catenatum]